MRVVGLGTQNDLDDAKAFAREVGGNQLLVWDESGRSWQQLGVRIQPASVLVRPDGTIIERWTSGIPFDEILDALP